MRMSCFVASIMIWYRKTFGKPHRQLAQRFEKVVVLSIYVIGGNISIEDQTHEKCAKLPEL